jgi:hypothetical protein
MKIPVYLYDNLIEVTLDLDNNNRIMQQMYQRAITLQKGVKNKIQLQFKNSDQKLLNVSTSSFVFILFDELDQRNLIQKLVTILDNGSAAPVYSSKGLGEVVFTENDLQVCESTYYKFGIKALDADGSYVPAYADTYYSVAGTLQVKHDLYPTLLPSQEVSNTTFITNRHYNSDIGYQQWEFYSGNINAYPQFKSNTALHTVAIYMTKFKGTVIIEGSLETSTNSFSNYAIINRKTYNGFTGIDYTNFNGVFSHVRIRYIPAKEPVTGSNNIVTSDLTVKAAILAYAGTVDKALYRS